MNRNKRLGFAHLSPLCVLLGLLGCTYQYDIEISNYNPAEACQGETVVVSHGYPKSLFAVDMPGNVLWTFETENYSDFWDFEILEGGDIIYLDTVEHGGTFRPPGTPVWNRWLPQSHHSILRLPWGNVLFLAHDYLQAAPWQEQLIGDLIREMNPDTGEIVWEWRLADFVSPSEHYCPLCMQDVYEGQYRDWSHSNALHYYADQSAILLGIRNLNTLLFISYPSGEILWACGEAGTFGGGIFHHAHDPELLPNGHVLMFDNDFHAGHPIASRALELAIDPAAGTAEVVWEWRDDQLWAPIMGDANRLPNGNTLVTDPHRGRVIEVKPSGGKVWEMLMKHPVPDRYHSIYKSERIPY